MHARIERLRPAGPGRGPALGIVALMAFASTAASFAQTTAAAAQYVQFGGLPTKALGPGPFGTGALYYQHAGRTDSSGAYLRTLSLRARLPHGVALQGGRFGYTSGSEAPSGRPKIEAVKRARIDARMIGEFEWSLYQRTFDGVRGDIDRKAWHVTGAWLRPTQGGFEEKAESSIRYNDDRGVTARPDNSGRTASRAAVGITTLGTAAVGTSPAGKGDLDWLAWSLALETGYQWKAKWQPWVRGGYLNASGDANQSDDRHATMNLRDLFAELIVRPTSRVTARADVRRLWLASGQDLWYAGSGATQNEGAADVAIARHVSANALFGAIRGGQVVTTSFKGRWLRFFYLESVVQW